MIMAAQHCILANE